MIRYALVLAVALPTVFVQAQSPSPSPSESASPEPSTSPSPTQNPSPSPSLPQPTNPYPVPEPEENINIPGYYNAYQCCIRAYRWQYCKAGGYYTYDHPRLRIWTPEGIPLPPQYTLVLEWADCPEKDWHTAYTRPEDLYDCNSESWSRKLIQTTFVRAGLAKTPEECAARAVPTWENVKKLREVWLPGGG